MRNEFYIANGNGMFGTQLALPGVEPDRMAWAVQRKNSYAQRSMVRLTIDVPEGALSSLHKDPQGFTRELRLAAAVKWYELRLLSQGRAAEVAGLSRAEFLDALGRFGVTPFQYSADEVVEEVARG